MTDARTALLIDFGSTFTKLRAIDMDAGRILGAGQGPSTVTTDVTEGLDAALADLERDMGTLPEFTHRLASSSAAGGLRMVTAGLVKELTAEAARQAALGAGARLVGTYAYKLTAGDARAIIELAPDILLLAGGTDGGNEDVIRANAERLADAGLDCPVVVAGNRNAADDVAATLAGAGLSVSVTGNVMPEFNVLDVEPARAAIRGVFIQRIVHAKGVDRAARRFDAVLMPTPAAVLAAARLLADGTDSTPGFGPLLVVDVGGATTDVHSVAEGAPTRDGVLPRGLPEPLAKRTVEGDLGMRINAAAIAGAAGRASLAAASGLSEDDVTTRLSSLTDDVETLPDDAAGRALDRALAAAAVAVAVDRHAGRLEVVQTVNGPITVQHGKDLGDIASVIGTGGVLAHGEDAAGVLSAALAGRDDDASVLRPRAPNLFIDQNYLLYAVGLLAEVDADAALMLARNTLFRVEGDSVHGRLPAA